MNLLEMIEPYKDEVIHVFRTGNIVSILLIDGIKVSKAFRSQECAMQHYKEFYEIFEEENKVYDDDKRF